MMLAVLRGLAPGFFADFEVYEGADRRGGRAVGHHKV